jgi:molybdopterin converting factor subunit 1
MRVRVMLFAHLVDRLGVRELELEVSEPTTVGGLRAAAAVRYPELSELLGACAVAVNLSYAGDGKEVCAGDELALIPPVSGG